MSEEPSELPPGERGSATSGCIILAAIVTVFGGLIILYTVIYFVQRKEIEKFTETTPAKIRQLDPTPAQIETMENKLKAIREATQNDRQERILFEADDINVMIAQLEILKDFRGTTYIDSISDRGIETKMSRPVRVAPLSPEMRHLNAKFLFWPELRRRTVAMRISDILPFKGSIPKRFVESYDAMSLFKLDPTNPNIKPHIPKISRIYIEPPHLVVETGTPADNQPVFEPAAKK